MKKFILYIIQFCSISFLCGQQSRDIQYPEVNKACPEFALDHMAYYPKSRVTSRELKGKHIILEFFSAWCSACFEGLPKLNRIQQLFGPDLQIFLVGSNTYDLPKTYNSFKVKLHLILPVSFDSVNFKKFDVTGVPYLVWIDDQGIVKAITSTTELSDEHIRAFIQNKPFWVRDVSNGTAEQVAKKMDSTFILNLQPYGEQELGASSLIAWNSSMPKFDNSQHFRFIGNHAYYQINAMDLDQLINLAYTGKTLITPQDTLYYGKLYTNPVFEIDSSQIEISDYTTGSGTYSFSMVTTPEKATQKYLKEKLLSDLGAYLDLDIRKESRMMPYWKLTASPGTGERLKSTFSKLTVTGGYEGFNIKGSAMSFIIQVLWSINQDEPPYIDETGITWPIDLNLDALMTDLKDVKKAFERNGFRLEEGRKLMDVLVVRKKNSLE